MLERLEKERFDAPQLVALRKALETHGAPAWREIARLQRLVGWADARRNQLFAPLAAMLLWGTQFSLAIELWRQRCGLRLAVWLETVGEIEALAALGSHAFENPDDPFPELVEGGPLFEGEGLGHPLLPSERCVRNDARLAAESAVLVVSGSNMSGKSTFLRSVGVNAVLALAGAPVRARRLRLSRLSLGASIRVNDSLQEGESRFYAEIKRLSQIVGLARDGAELLFLLDEVLHGTNSHDRQIGAAAVVRGLVELGAIGLVTTHDLALARIADELAPRAANVHFEDHLEGGRIAFDYQLRPGVVTRSNALALMREVGLDV
jgi:DNA mismatch repair ATPase MutS